MRLGIDFGTTRVVIAVVDRGNYPLVSFDTADGTFDWFPPLIAMKGAEPRKAAAEAAEEVALPVLASTLTTMAVLLPVVLLAGLAQRLFVPLALTGADCSTECTATAFVSWVPL